MRLNPYSTGSNSNDALDYANVLNRKRLNPYSTGSNSNNTWKTSVSQSLSVLILILLEVTQMKVEKDGKGNRTFRLNPYSTGSNSNQSDTAFIVAGTVLILILLEVTQIRSDCTLSVFSKCLNPYSTGSNSNFSMDGCLCRYWRMS